METAPGTAKKQEAICKAISILHSDDASDLFKKSFESKCYTFLRVKEQDDRHQKNDALQVVRPASMAVGDGRLAEITSRLSKGAHFEELIESVDQVMTMLKAEEAEDLKHKETCEEDKAADTRKATKFSKPMDENREAINALKAETENRNTHHRTRED